MRIQRILVPTDFSSRARLALRHAIELAQEPAAAIDVVHVLAPPSSVYVAVDAYLGLRLPQVPDAVRAQADEQLSLLVSSLPAGRAQIERLIEVGDPAAVIVRLAVERRADLIVIGTRARQGLAEALLGSVAHRVIGCAPCPVLTLRGSEASLKETTDAVPDERRGHPDGRELETRPQPVPDGGERLVRAGSE
jgi:nucleotide-binding universal stress UspA family protein